MQIIFPKKVTDQNIDRIISGIYKNYSIIPNDTYAFDLTEVEYMGNQELLTLTAILKLFYSAKIKFKVDFLKPYESTKDIPDRVKKQIIQIWEVWKIGTVLPSELCMEYFGISTNIVNRLKKELDYYPELSELYNRHGVTPFIYLDYINNYNESLVTEKIKDVYQLNTIIESLLKKENCHHPFTSNALSTIITEELFLNFLDHSGESSFIGLPKIAFMSISFQGKLKKKNTQSIKKLNFDTECLPESLHYFYDTKHGIFKNFPSIQFSFLDFGKGIALTLKKQYLSNHPKSDNDSQVIKYAFEVESSRHPITDAIKSERLIPRGLFDAMTIVKRYRGMLTVRSNFGKVLFDFSNPDNPIIKEFGQIGTDYFPGTLININIPAIENDKLFRTGPIKKERVFKVIPPHHRKVFNFTEVVDSLNDLTKDVLYTTLFSKIKDKILLQLPSLVFVNFEGTEKVERRILKKALYFFLTDHSINHDSNIVLLNFPNNEIVMEVEGELKEIDRAFRDYKIHPLPLIFWDFESDRVDLTWLGVFDYKDKDKLKDLLYGTFSIARSDLNNPNQLTGHILDFDKHGNLVTNIIPEAELLKFLKTNRDDGIKAEVIRLIEKHKCIFQKDNSIYLSSGNFYQYHFLELTNIVNNKIDCDIIAKLLFDSIKNCISNTGEYIYIAITTTSQKIVKSFIAQGLISESAVVLLENYKHFDSDEELNKIKESNNCILVCDVISTGYLTARLNHVLQEKGATLNKVAVIANTCTDQMAKTFPHFKEIGEKIISLINYPIEKYRKEFISNMTELDIIRINPFTNIPVALSINETRYDESVIFKTTTRYDKAENTISIDNQFLNKIRNDDILIGFLEFNNLVHPYFFNTENILREAPEEEIQSIFKRIGKDVLYKDKIKLFYPRRSGIESLQIDKIRSSLNNHSIEEVPIERFGTTEGWRFPHNSNYLENVVSNNICLILDDGSCSGDSLIQMIDEIAFYNAREIILICVISRIKDHKREFFSRLSTLTVKKGITIKLSIYFISHWHIPTYYIDDNPNTRELNWLTDIINLTNTPASIRKIAETVKEAIEPKPRHKFSDYKYLPKIKGGGVPKKELLMIREELGKVIGFRLYSESFQFFDCFFKKYEKRTKSSTRYKEIELLCAVFIYEPYLYPKLQDTMPDIEAQIEDFVRILLLRSDSIYDKLTYHWNKKDIVHLFFIVFKDQKLFKVISDIDNFKKIVDFTSPHESALNYVLYKLLQYYPLKKEDVHKKPFADELLSIIGTLSKFIQTKEIKKYYNFLQTLPSKESFLNQLRKLADGYIKQKGPEYHDEKRSFNHNISNIVAAIRVAVAEISEPSALSNETIQEIRTAWFGIQDFLKPILTFASSFPGFLKPYPYYGMIEKVEGSDTSLRSLIGISEEIIMSLYENYIDIEKLNILEYNLIKIQSGFQVGTLFNQLIDAPNCEMREFLTGLKGQLISEGLSPIFEEPVPSFDYKISIPKIYINQLLIKELATNIRQHSTIDTTSYLPVTVKIKDNKLILMIKNTAIQSGGGVNGEGIKCIKLLEDFDPFGFTYSARPLKDAYIQTLTFKLVSSNGYQAS
jgi:hypothetical protein